eukprot:201616_1
MNPLLTTLSFAVVIHIFGFTNAGTIDSSTITGSTITCVQNENCLVNCINCDSYTINCPSSGNSCAIACQSCNSAIVIAEQVTDFVFNCTDTCSDAVIKSSLSTIDSQFRLNCVASDACNGLDATISHVSSVYTSATAATNTAVNINCQGATSCANIYIDSTVKGAFVAKCNGLRACDNSNFVYNPPQNTGQMNIDCQGRESCASGMKIVSLSTRQINLNCNNGNSSSSEGQGACDGTIFGPVLPFALDETIFAFYTAYNDSVVLQCHQPYDCSTVSINVPLGPHQVIAQGYTRALGESRDSTLNYLCGYDYFGGEWDQPNREIYCRYCDLELRKIVLAPLNEDATIIITNPYTFDLSSTGSTITCPTSGDCFVYTMDRYTDLLEHTASSAATNIICPTDGISSCHIYAVQKYGASLSDIDGTKSKFLLIKGLEEAKSAFTSTTVHGPEAPYVTDGIMYLASGNAYKSFKEATIHSESVMLASVPKIFDALIGGSFYAGDATHVAFTCDYHSMCANLTIYVNHDSFNLTSASESDIIPDSVCVTCSDFYAASGSCAGLRLLVKDTANSNVEYQFDAVFNDSGPGNWSWSYNNGQVKVPMAPAGGDQCGDVTENALGGYWPRFGSYCPLDVGAPPDTCKSVESFTGSVPMLDGFCYSFGPFSMSYQWQCINNMGAVTVYQSSDNCTGSGSSPAPPSACDATRSCNCAWFTLHEFDQTLEYNTTCNPAHYATDTRQALFVDQCLSNGYMYECKNIDGLNTILLHEYANTDCTSLVNTSVYLQEEQCLVNHRFLIGSDSKTPVYVDNINCTCFGDVDGEVTDSPTNPPTNPPTTTAICEAQGDTEYAGWMGVQQDKCEYCFCEETNQTGTAIQTIVQGNGNVVQLKTDCNKVTTLPVPKQQQFLATCTNLDCDFDDVEAKPEDTFTCDCDGFVCGTGASSDAQILRFTFPTVLLSIVCFIFF